MKTVILAIFLSAFIVYLYYRHSACGWCGAEGFQAKPTAKPTPNPLAELVKKLTSMSKYLSDTAMWKERITMVNMTPIELARRHLDQLAKNK
jgi:hypothetical protein